VTLSWLAARLQAFADLHDGFDVPAGRLATWLARADDEDEDDQTVNRASRDSWLGG
jgi:hypothetical protein